MRANLEWPLEELQSLHNGFSPQSVPIDFQVEMSSFKQAQLYRINYYVYTLFQKKKKRPSCLWILGVGLWLVGVCWASVPQTLVTEVDISFMLVLLVFFRAAVI